MISEFKGEYRWLSNFEPVEIVLDGVKYPSIEHAYMSAKSNDIKWKEFCSDSKNSPGLVKRKSKNIVLIDNWVDVKLSIMTECVRQKFSQDPYKDLLLKTGNKILQEGNLWNDTFWGVCLKSNTGKNHLGKIIMEYRRILNNRDFFI